MNAVSAALPEVQGLGGLYRKQDRLRVELDNMYILIKLWSIQ